MVWGSNVDNFLLKAQTSAYPPSDVFLPPSLFKHVPACTVPSETVGFTPPSRLGAQRQQVIDRFIDPRSQQFVFLLATKAGGVGINLTVATTCIIFDSDWNPQSDLQAQARCHRIGQTRAVKVYRLIVQESVEEKLFDVATQKLGLDKVVLARDPASLFHPLLSCCLHSPQSVFFFCALP